MSRNMLRLVSSDDKQQTCTKSDAIENIFRDFRVNYQSFYTTDLEETRKGNRAWRKETWLKALDEYSVETITMVLDLIVRGKTPFSCIYPTASQYAELCYGIESKKKAAEARSQFLGGFE
jgi:hypothetical protein